MVRYIFIQCLVTIYQGDKMAEIAPFRGVLYNPERVDPSLTMAPPYDIISPAMKEELYARSKYNVVRIDFGKDMDEDDEWNNRYTRASEYLNDWMREGILVQDDKPSFYCYEITYEHEGAEKRTRGLLCLVKIEDLGTGSIHPHEMTYSKPKTDRLNILRYCQANTSPIYSLYSSDEKVTTSILRETVETSPVYLEARNGENFIHRLWKIQSPEKIERIREEIRGRDIFIADGHHRYETALQYSRQMEVKNKGGDAPFNYVLMYLVNIEEHQLTLLPTHRIVEVNSSINIKSTLKDYFEIEKISRGGAPEETTRRDLFSIMKETPHSFGLYLTNTNSYYLLKHNGIPFEMDVEECMRDLDVSILHEFIFRRLSIDHFEYEMDSEVAVQRARTGPFEAVFFLNPTEIESLKKVALAGKRMPPKSTYFYPKLLTGMVIYKFDP